MPVGSSRPGALRVASVSHPQLHPNSTLLGFRVSTKATPHPPIFGVCSSLLVPNMCQGSAHPSKNANKNVGGCLACTRWLAVWALSSGFCALGSGLWDLGSGLWALDSGLCALRRNVSSAGGALPCFRLRRFPRAARNPVATQPMALTYTYDLSAELRDVCSFSIDTT